MGDTLSPATVEVGDGATLLHYTDRTPVTVVAVRKNGKQLVIRECRATLDPTWERDFRPGGFFGHTANNAEQRWIIDPTPVGSEQLANWSAKQGRYRVGGTNGTPLRAGRTMFHDYNF